MTDTELRLAIDQAWAHTQKTGPGAALREAEEHLTHLRAVQADRAKSPQHGPPVATRGY